MKTFPGAAGIFHQAAIPSVPRSVKDPLASNEANVTGMPIAAKGCGVPAVVAASSSVWRHPRRRDHPPHSTLIV
ncbi:MAG: hypothetical protein GX880_10270 [Methanomicrobiales archaeon]|nr:hypothetical protein [Methanomicrobiales archaeon]